MATSLILVSSSLGAVLAVLFGVVDGASPVEFVALYFFGAFLGSLFAMAQLIAWYVRTEHHGAIKLH